MRPPKCNCQQSKKKDCPIPGACVEHGVIYQATVTNVNRNSEKYVALAKHFKQRYAKHKASRNKKTPENSTTLSSHFWRKKGAGGNSSVVWKILEHDIPNVNPLKKTCRLCLREKCTIAFAPQEATLNSRKKNIGHCRHIGGCLLKPPDWSPRGSQWLILYCYSM